MSLYVDSSALTKLYLEEIHTEECRALMAADTRWVTASHPLVEVQRAISRALDGPELAAAEVTFAQDWSSFGVIELDLATCVTSARVAVEQKIKTLDALHLGAAQRATDGDVAFLTYDNRQANAARSLGFAVVPS